MSFAKKRSNGYYGVAVYRDKNGKRHQKGAGTFRLKREALAAADKLEQKLGAIDVELSMMSFADYYQRWYDLYKKNGISDISRSRYEIFGREIANYFGNKKTIDIRRSDYQGFINQYGANLPIRASQSSMERLRPVSDRPLTMTSSSKILHTCSLFITKIVK